MPANWTAGNGAEVEYDTGGTSGGGANRMLRFYNDGSSSYMYQTIPTVIGQRYQIDLWYEAQNSSLSIKWLSGNSANASTNGSTQWNVGSDGDQATKTEYFIATATTTYITFSIISGTDGASVFVDDIQVKAFNPKAPKVLPPVGIDEGVVFEGDTKVNSQSYMYFPTGDTSQRGRGRGLIGNVGGEFSNGIHYVQIQTSGNSIDFGDTTIDKRRESVVCSATRGLFAGGDAPSGGSETNVISYVTIATTGNAVDYGDLTAASGMGSGCSSNTRGVIMLGYDHPTAVVNLDYVTIASAGNAADFGDSTEARNNTGSLSSPTRGIFAGGSPSYKSTIDYVTIASTGNATDFGDFDRNVISPAGASSSTRGVFCAGGANMSPNQFANNRMEYITIASTGNTVHFGDLQHKRGNASGLSNSTTAVIAGGCTDNGGSTATNAMEFITIASTGNGVEFGDTTATCLRTQGTSDSHGGLS